MACERWVRDLRNAGLKASDERVAVVARCLVDNYIGNMKRLRDAGDPASWLRSDVLLTDELTFLAGLTGNRGSGRRSRSRSRGLSIGASSQQVSKSQVRD